MKFSLGLQKQKKKEKQQNVENLKQEVNLDDHKITLEELCARFKTSIEHGLTEALAKAYLERDGLNQLTPPATVSRVSIFDEIMWSSCV